MLYSTRRIGRPSPKSLGHETAHTDMRVTTVFACLVYENWWEQISESPAQQLSACTGSSQLVRQQGIINSYISRHILLLRKNCFSSPSSDHKGRSRRRSGRWRALSSMVSKQSLVLCNIFFEVYSFI